MSSPGSRNQSWAYSVNAGNSSGITDGAAAVLVMSESYAKEIGVTPMATWEDYAAAGVDPHVMGLGPVPSTKRLLERTGRALGDFDLIELNEAFAAQVIACHRELQYDPARLNVHGGAIATLIDTVVVPPVGWVFPEVPQMLTLTLNVEYRAALIRSDAVAEGWITQRGRSIVFCEAEVRAADDARVVASGRMVYKVRPATSSEAGTGDG